MRILSWNCRGMGRAPTVRALRNLALQHRANLLFLMETKCSVRSLEGFARKLGFKFWAGIDAIGPAGSIWAAWDGCYSVEVIRCHPRFILLREADEMGRCWLLVFLYGHPYLCRRKDT